MQGKYGLTAAESQFAGRGVQQEFMQQEIPKIEQEKEVLGYMFKHPFTNAQGQPAPIGTDRNGKPYAPTMMNYAIDNHGQLSPPAMKALQKRFPKADIPGMMRYFGGS